MTEPGTSSQAQAWPELPWTEWKPTIDTLHMWLQVVGKVRMALAAPRNHWWHTTLYVTSRGLTTSPIPIGTRDFQIDLDFIDHRLDVVDTLGLTFEMTLAPMSVATFYREFMAGLRQLGIEVRIWTKPVEVDLAIPFEQDEQHASYQPMHHRPLPAAMPYGWIEVGREAETLVMIGAVAWIAGRSPLERLAWGSVIFRVWDIGYYAWLWVFSGWPPSVGTWDLLFLIPAPWAGPVWAPIVVSSGLIGFGTACAGRLRAGVLPAWAGSSPLRAVTP